MLGTDYAPNDQTIDYSYDPVNRLTAADYDSGLYYHYTYDAVGNRLEQVTAFTAPPITNAYTYDNANRLTALDEQTYTFDDNGNLLSDGEYTYTYDSANRLVGVSKAETSESYAYNGNGDRLQQTVNGTSENFTLDLNIGLAQVLASQGDTYLYGLNRLGFERGGQEYQYLHDALGSVRQAVKTSGEFTGLVSATTYDPYGNVVFSLGENTPLGFTGEMQDQSLNDMVYLRERYYTSETGRFLTKDTWQGNYNAPLSLNKWNYVNGNPINYSDPSGRCYGPVSFLRNVPVESGICEHLDQAMFIYAWPGSTSTQRNIAAAYIGGWAFGHSALIVGAGGLAVAGGKEAILALYGLYKMNPVLQQQTAKTCQDASVWILKPFQRGIEIENQLGRSPELVQNFPVIDKFTNGVVTSYKSIDLAARTYQNISTLTWKVQSYVTTLANWQGASWAGFNINLQMISSRELILAIPPNATQIQMQAILNIIVWAQRLGVVMKIVTLP